MVYGEKHWKTWFKPVEKDGSNPLANSRALFDATLIKL